MEAESEDQRFWKTVLFVIAVLFLPLVFKVVAWNIGEFAYEHGLFYMQPDLPTIFAVIIAPLTLIYLWLRKSKPKLSKFFAVFATTAVLTTLAMITATDTAKYEPITKISEEFVTPEGWAKLPSKESKYEYFGGSWSKQDGNAPITSKDLQQIASNNNLKNYRMDGECPATPPRTGCSLYGDIDGAKVNMLYLPNYYPREASSKLTISVDRPKPPKSYKPEPRHDIGNW